MKVLAPQLLSFLRYSHFKFHKKWRRGAAAAAPRRQVLKSTTQTSLGSRMRSIRDMIKIFFASYKASSRVYSTRKVCHDNTYWRRKKFLCQFSTTKFKRVVNFYYFSTLGNPYTFIRPTKTFRLICTQIYGERL